MIRQALISRVRAVAPPALSLALAATLALALAPAAAPPAAAQEEGYGAHLASYFGRADAERGWRILQKRIPAQLKGRSPLYREAVVKGRTYVRLLVGPFPAVAPARSYCAEVKRGWSYCDVLSLSDLKPVAAAPAPKPMAEKPAPKPMAEKPMAEKPMPEPKLDTKPVTGTDMADTKDMADGAMKNDEAMEKDAMGNDGAGAGKGIDFRIEGKSLPPLPQVQARLSPQQRAVYRAIEGNWIQFDGNCSTDLMQIGEGAVRRIDAGTAKEPDACEVRREGPTVALFCGDGREMWLELINDDEMVLRRTKAHGGAPYETIDQLLSRCRKG